ncbi:MAG TPA: hypothetical protein VM143_14160 [Acidimicrobiales bacterium]|nr:hypothetical protein [Acidimicrobiales bacterium]
MLDDDPAHRPIESPCEVNAVARLLVTMMRHLRFAWARRRARRAMRRAVARGRPNWQREDLYDRI